MCEWEERNRGSGKLGHYLKHFKIYFLQDFMVVLDNFYIPSLSKLKYQSKCTHHKILAYQNHKRTEKNTNGTKQVKQANLC